jgi:hypothetical protein
MFYTSLSSLVPSHYSSVSLASFHYPIVELNEFVSHSDVHTIAIEIACSIIQ